MYRLAERLVAAMVVVLMVPVAAQADSFPKMPGGVDVTAQATTLYNAGDTSHVFTYTGQTYSASDPSFVNGSFDMTVYLTDTGSIDVANLGLDTLTVTGGSSSGNSLFASNNLLAFRYEDVGGLTLHFLWGPGGGGTSQYGTVGPIGVNVNATMGDTFSDFATDFTMSLANADAFNAVPLPSAVVMGLSILPFLALYRKHVQRA